MIDRPVDKRIRRGKAILSRVLIDRDLGDVSYADVIPSTPGRENYRVALFWEGDRPADGACTCPDFRTKFQGLGEPLFNGPRGQFRVCKHMVAVGIQVVERRRKMCDREPRKKSLKQALLEHGVRATTDGTRTLQRMLDTAQNTKFRGEVPASGLSPKDAVTLGEGPDGVPRPEQLFGNTVFVVSGINHLPVGSHKYAGKFERHFDDLAAAKAWAAKMFNGQMASGVPTAARLAATIKINAA